MPSFRAAMSCIHLGLLAAVAAVGNSEECSMPEVGTSMLQHSGQGVVTKQQIERESERRKKIVDGIVERRIIFLAVGVKMGLPVTDAVALARAFASGFKPSSEANNLQTTKTLESLTQEQYEILEHMFCHVKTGGEVEASCDSDFKQLVETGLSVLAGVGASVLQLLSAKNAESRVEGQANLREGNVDPVLLDDFSKHFHVNCQIMVVKGELPESAIEMASTAMKRLIGMDDEYLFASVNSYAGYSLVHLVKSMVVSQLSASCLMSTGSCLDVLSSEIWAFDHPTEEVGTSLLQTGKRQLLRLMMKFLDTPEHPVESAKERKAAVTAYLKQQSDEEQRRNM